jgi:hypothetical protein
MVEYYQWVLGLLTTWNFIWTISTILIFYAWKKRLKEKYNIYLNNLEEKEGV